MQESVVSACEILKAGENASIPLDSVDETLDDVALFVAELVIVALSLAMAARRDDHLDLLGCEQDAKRVRIIAFVGNDSVKVEWSEQRFSLGDVMTFSARQNEA